MKSLMFIASAAAFAAILTTAAPASADPIVTPSPVDPEWVQTTVVLGDLDMNRAADAETAARRIRRAVKAVCGGDDAGLFPLTTRMSWRACSEASMRDALSRLNNPMVTRAAYGEKAPAAYAAR